MNAFLVTFKFITPVLKVCLNLSAHSYDDFVKQNVKIIIIIGVNGIKIKNIPNMFETFRIIKYSSKLLTTDSFTSHIAQLLRDDFVIVLSRDFKENIIHPGCNARVLANHPPCAPCNYQERTDFKHCVAGYEFCAAFENREFVHSIAAAFKAD